MTLLQEVVTASGEVSATRSRTRKIEILAALLGGIAIDEVAIVVAYLSGEPRQGRIGVGYATVSDVTVPPAATATLSVGEVDGLIAALAAAGGGGSVAERASLLGELLGRATADEQLFLRRLLTGGLRQGALAGIMADAVARAAGVPGPVARRALMLSGDLARMAEIAMRDGEPGLSAVRLELFRPILPMLAGTASSVTEAVGTMARASVEWKLDGIRVQIHRSGDKVRVYTRGLNDITASLPGVVAVVRALPVAQVVLDGEALWMTADGPAAFQDTVSQIDADAPPEGIVIFLFDLLHLDGEDLLDAPLHERKTRLTEIAPGLVVPSLYTSDPDQGERVLGDALTAGHEGVVVKDADSVYAAGRRGATWRKVKPVHTYDLVVLAAEWGHGRRQGWLSNLHLGARDPDTGGFVMVGKTFKGLTDALLTWQTTELLTRETGRQGIAVHVRPELVVEIALDGVQTSRRYPGGVALRFARVKAYRPDKRPEEADTIGTLRALLS